MICTFFGHSECYGLDREKLLSAIEEQIRQGADVFYVGHQGQFDRMVLGCLKQLKKTYEHIRFAVVLAYLPTEKRKYDDTSASLYPEGLETVHPKFAIERRNYWMIEHSEICLCYINHTWGGAYKFAKQANTQGLTIVNLGETSL